MGYEEDDDLDYGYVPYEYDVRKERPIEVDSTLKMAQWKDKCFNNAINVMIAELASTPLAGKPSIDLAKKMYEVYLNGEVKI